MIIKIKIRYTKQYEVFVSRREAMIIRNGMVFGNNRKFEQRDLYIANGRIAAEESQVTDAEVIEVEGLYVVPGLIDIHSHGAVGYDFSDADILGLQKILAYEFSCGVTSYCPTSMTLPKEQLLEIVSTVNKISSQENLAEIAGIHMEGPFIDVKKKGAHMQVHICEPDISFFKECMKKSGNQIRLVTIAPNIQGAIEFIREVKDETVVSLGHTAVDYETAKAALKAGACHVTHLYNAMEVFSHRAPGLIGAAAETEGCMVELICDGIHVHESVVRATFKMFKDRVVLISDSIRATGMPDGIYELGGQQVQVCNGKAVLNDGTIAGSVTNLFEGMKKAVTFGIPLEDAVAAVTINPAISIGIADEVGSFLPGKRADVLLINKDLELVRVIKGK